MGLFSALVRTTVNVVTLPVDVVKDAVMVPCDIADGENVGHRTADKLQTIKREAE